MSQSEHDLRIQEAEAVKGLTKHPGYKILLRKYNEVKDIAFDDLCNEALSDDSLKARQVIYNQICEWMYVPDLIIQDGDNAVAEMKVDETRPETKIKRAVKFIGRQ